MKRSEFRALLNLNRHKLGRRLNRPAPPDPQARLYIRALKRVTQSMEVAQDRLVAALKRLSPEPVSDSVSIFSHAAIRSLCQPPPGMFQTDVKDRFWDQRAIAHEIQDAQAEFWKQWTGAKMAGLVRPVAEDTAKFQAQSLNNQLRPVVGVDVVGSEPWLDPAVKQFVTRNVALIKSIPERFFAEVEATVTKEASKGERWENLAKTVQERWGVSVSRAKLIAKDQVNKFYGELNRERQRGLGIRKATWRTAADNRVRDEHEALNGTVYDLDNPPEGGPGQPVGCRCYDDPDLESVTEAEPEAPAEAEPEAENDPALTEPEAPNTVEGMTVAQTTQENLARAPEAFTAAGDRHLFSFKGGRFVLRGTR